MPLHRHHHHHHHSNFLAQLLQLFSHTLVCFLDITVQLHYLLDYLDLGHEEVTRNRQNKYIITFYGKKNSKIVAKQRNSYKFTFNLTKLRASHANSVCKNRKKRRQKCLEKKKLPSVTLVLPENLLSAN